MHIDDPATPSSWLCRWLLCAMLMLGSAPVLGEPYQARDESLHTFFSALALPLGLPVIVSREAARKRVSGTFDFDKAQATLEAVALEQGLIWYGDGQAIYLYDAGEAKSSAVALRHISVERLRAFMRGAGLEAARHPLRESGGRTFYVSGPPNYVDQVLRLAQLMDRQRPSVRVGAQTFGVIQVLNSHVEDRHYSLGDDPVQVPGIASTINRVLSGEQSSSRRPRAVLADPSIAVIAYPDTNSLLVKGSPEQVRAIEDLVTQLDTPKRSIEVSLWRVDVDRDELQKIDAAWAQKAKPAASSSQVLEPMDDYRLMTQIGALERRRLARVVALPVILAQENVPALFNDNQTFYAAGTRDHASEWQPLRYGTQVSVLPRFAEANHIEMLLRLEDGRQIGRHGRGGQPAAVGRAGVSSVIRVAPGRRLWLGPFARDSDGAGRSLAGRGAEVRLFVIQAREVGRAPQTLAGAVGPPPLTQAQYERVQRAFVRRQGEVLQD